MLECERVEAERTARLYHKAIGGRHQVIIIFRSRNRVDIGHTIITCRDADVRKVHGISIIFVAIHIEIRRRAGTDINTVVELLLSVSCIHGYEIEKGTAYRGIRFRALRFRGSGSTFATHIGGYPAGIRTMCGIGIRNRYFKRGKLRNDGGIGAVSLRFIHDGIVQRYTLNQELFQFIICNTIIPRYSQTRSQTFQHQAHVVAAVRTLNDSFTIDNGYLYMLQMKHVRHSVHTPRSRGVNRIYHGRIYYHTLYLF